MPPLFPEPVCVWNGTDLGSIRPLRRACWSDPVQLANDRGVIVSVLAGRSESGGGSVSRRNDCGVCDPSAIYYAGCAVLCCSIHWDSASSSASEAATPALSAARSNRSTRSVGIEAFTFERVGLDFGCGAA